MLYSFGLLPQPLMQKHKHDDDDNDVDDYDEKKCCDVCKFICNEWVRCRITTFHIEIVFSATWLSAKLSTRRTDWILASRKGWGGRFVYCECAYIYLIVPRVRIHEKKKSFTFFRCEPYTHTFYYELHHHYHHQEQNKPDLRLDGLQRVNQDGFAVEESLRRLTWSVGLHKGGHNMSARQSISWKLQFLTQWIEELLFLRKVANWGNLRINLTDDLDCFEERLFYSLSPCLSLRVRSLECVTY